MFIWLSGELAAQIDNARMRTGDTRLTYIKGAILDAIDRDGVLVPDDVIARELAFIHSPAGGIESGEHAPRCERWPAAPAAACGTDRSRPSTRAQTTSLGVPPQTPPVAS